MAIEKKRYEEILEAAGFSELVTAYLWATKDKELELREDSLRSLVANTNDEQKRYLELVARRWRARQDATS